MYTVRSFIYVDYERTFFPKFFQTLICLNSGEAIPLDDVCNVSRIRNKHLTQNAYKYRKSLIDWCDKKQKVIDQYSEDNNTNSSTIDTNDESDLLQLPQGVERVVKDTDQQIEEHFLKVQRYYDGGSVSPFYERIILFEENPVLQYRLKDLLQSRTSVTQRLTENLESLCQKALSESTSEDKNHLSNDEYNLALLSDVW